MKKFFIVFIALLLVILPCITYAAPTKNYFQGYSWNQKYSCTIVSAENLSVTATHIKTTYSSPAINITPALKNCFYQNNMPTSVTVKLSGKIKITYKDGANTPPKMHLVIRAKINLRDPETWQKGYFESLNGDEPFFKNASSNVLRSISSDFFVTDVWTEFSTNITISRNNVFSDYLNNMNFCFDGIKPYESIDILEVTDFKMELVSVSNDSAPAITPPRVTPNVTVATNPPTQTKKPVVTPKPTASPKPLEETKDEFLNQPLMKDINDILSWTIKGSAVIILIVGFFVIILYPIAKNKKE